MQEETDLHTLLIDDIETDTRTDFTRWEVNPYCLISWYEMEEFKARQFYAISIILEQLVSRYDLLKRNANNPILIDIDDSAAPKIRAELETMEKAFRKIGLRNSADLTHEFKSLMAISAGAITAGKVVNGISEIQRSIARELKHNLFMYIPIERANYYDSWGKNNRAERGEELPLFGDAVNTAFPSAIYDIAEAGNSYAAGRYTACVFHLMRALEIGLRVFANVFNIDADHSNWHNVIEQIQSRIEEIGKGKNKPPGWTKDDQEFYAQVASHFFILKEAWRNYTAHVRGKYTEEEAEEIMRNTKSFMQKLSKKLAE